MKILDEIAKKFEESVKIACDEYKVIKNNDEDGEFYIFLGIVSNPKKYLELKYRIYTLNLELREMKSKVSGEYRSIFNINEFNIGSNHVYFEVIIKVERRASNSNGIYS